MSEGLNEQQERAAFALSMGGKPDEVAKAVGVSRVTLWRWRKDPEFAAVVEGHREALQAEGRTLLNALVVDAVGLLGKTIETYRDSGEPDKAVRAAVEVLNRVGLVETKRQEVAATLDVAKAVDEVLAGKTAAELEALAGDDDSP